MIITISAYHHSCRYLVVSHIHWYRSHSHCQWIRGHNYKCSHWFYPYRSHHSYRAQTHNHQCLSGSLFLWIWKLKHKYIQSLMAVIGRTNIWEQQTAKQVCKWFYESQKWLHIVHRDLALHIEMSGKHSFSYTSYYHTLCMQLIIKAADIMGVYYRPGLTIVASRPPNWAKSSKNKKSKQL